MSDTSRRMIEIIAEQVLEGLQPLQCPDCGPQKRYLFNRRWQRWSCPQCLAVITEPGMEPMPDYGLKPLWPEG